MRPITEIIIHCTATEFNWWAGRSTAAKVAEVKRWHVQERKWRDIGYHFLIDRDGTVATGRPLDQVGAHVAGHNAGTIGIALFGGHRSNEKDKFRQHYTPEQDKALRALIADLRSRLPAIMRVTGHNQYAAKACPGFQVSEWLAEKPEPKPEQKPANTLGKPSWFGALIAAIAAMVWSKK
jgi:N-acetylmuramoyl-L-alanine amidase